MRYLHPLTTLTREATFGAARLCGVVAAAMLLIAQVAAAEMPRPEACAADLGARSAPAWSTAEDRDPAADWSLAAFTGLSCARCDSRIHYCVMNPIRYEYACAPLGTVACISAERTSWCPPGRSCWAGRCR